MSHNTEILRAQITRQKDQIFEQHDNAMTQSASVAAQFSQFNVNCVPEPLLQNIFYGIKYF